LPARVLVLPPLVGTNVLLLVVIVRRLLASAAGMLV
jgi:hypothetical protein